MKSLVHTDITLARTKIQAGCYNGGTSKCPWQGCYKMLWIQTIVPAIQNIELLAKVGLRLENELESGCFLTVSNQTSNGTTRSLDRVILPLLASVTSFLSLFQLSFFTLLCASWCRNASDLLINHAAFHEPTCITDDLSKRWDQLFLKTIFIVQLSNGRADSSNTHYLRFSIYLNLKLIWMK